MEEKLHHFYKATLSDPLFAAEGMDLEQGVAALNRIEGQCKEMEKYVGADSWKRRLFLARYPISKYALPLVFLRAFIESEQERRIFLSLPTNEAALKLLYSWKKTSRAYAQNVRRYRLLHKLLLAIEKKSDSFQFEDFAMHVTSIANVKRVLSLLEKNAEALGEEVARREALLVRGVPYRNERSVSKLPPYKPSSVSASHQRLIDLHVQHGAPFRDHTIVETIGPFAYTLAHFDNVPTEHVFYAHIVQDAGSQARFIKINLADQFYFLDLSTVLDARNKGVQTPVIERGFSHWYQSVTHGYSTRDQLYVADMATAIDLQRRPWLATPQVSMQRSSTLDLILMGISYDFDMAVGHAKERSRLGLANAYSYLDVLLIRTHPSLFYLPFNASVWRLPELPQFLGHRRDGEPKYKTLDTIEDKLSEGMLELIMQGGRIREEARRAAENS